MGRGPGLVHGLPALVIWSNGPWKNLQEVEFATLAWVDWFNNLRLLEPLSHVPPAEIEEMDYEEQEGPDIQARLNRTGLRDTQGGSKRDRRRALGGRRSELPKMIYRR